MNESEQSMTRPDALRLSGMVWEDADRPALCLFWESNDEQTTTERPASFYAAAGTITLSFAMQTKPDLVDLYVELFPPSA